MKTIYAVVGAALLSTSVQVHAKTHLKWTRELSTNVRLDSKGVIRISIPSFAAHDLTTAELIRALQHYPDAQAFRVLWEEAAFGHWYKGTAFYNRRQQSLVVYWMTNDEKGITGTWARYINVTSSVLNQVANSRSREQAGNPGGMAPRDGGFRDMALFGAKMVASHTKNTKVN